MLKKIATVTAAVLLAASCSASPEELKETYFEKMQEYGVSKSEAIDSVDLMCTYAQNGEAKATRFMANVRSEGGSFAEIAEVIVEFGIPAYCPKFVGVYETESI